MRHLAAAQAAAADQILAGAQRAGRLPSSVAGLVDAGALVWVGSAGEHPGAAGGDPADTQYRIGSISKTFTAVLLLQARDAGLIDLSAPLGTYVPEAPFADRPLSALLSHSSGLPKEPVGPWWERHDGGDLTALLEDNQRQEPLADVGVEPRYSNLAYGLLGAVAVRVLGAPWWDLVRGRILDPLGMSRTTYLPTAPHAQGYSVSHLLNTRTPEPHTDTGAMAPAGQLWSTVADLATYADFVLHGHADVLTLATLEEAAREVLPGGDYGLGFRVAGRDDLPLVGHTGTMPGFMASFFCDRRHDRASIVLSNATTGQLSVQVSTDLHDVLEGTLGPTEPVAAWSPSLEVDDEVRELVGGWYWGEIAFEIRWNGAELELVETRPGEAYEEYHRDSEGRWIGTDRTELEIHRDPAGAVDHLVSETYEFTRTPYGR